MGAAQSSSAAGPLAAQQLLLERLAGAEAIPYSDSAFWDALFGGLPTPLAALDPAGVELALAPVCRQLLVNNAQTHNFQALLGHVAELLAAAVGGAPSLAAANGLHVAVVLLKLAIEMASPATLAGLFELVGPSAPADAQGQGSLLPLFMARVTGVVSGLKPGGAGGDELAYLLLHEALRALVVACSTQLYSPSTHAPPGAHPLAEAAASLNEQQAPGLLSALLALATDRSAPPPRLQLRRRPGGGGGGGGSGSDAGGYGVTRLARSLSATVLWAPSKAYQLLAAGSGTVTGACTVNGAAAAAAAAAAKRAGLNSGAAGGGGVMMLTATGGGSGGAGQGKVPVPLAAGSPIAELALAALLLLLHFPAQHAGRSNALRDALAGLQDAAPAPPPAAPAADNGAAAAAAVAVAAAVAPAPPAAAAAPAAAPRVTATASFSRLYGFFATGPPSEASTLLLYGLLHGCRAFREYCLVRGDVEALLLPLLAALYACGSGGAAPNHAYMLQVVVLMLSQDAPFARAIHKVTLAGGVPWYRERMLGGRVTLGSLAFAVLLRTASSSFGSLRDPYLPTNTLAALANLAPHAVGLHAHAAQRLVSLAAALARRHARLTARLQALAAGDFAAAAGAGQQQQQQQQQDAQQQPQPGMSRQQAEELRERLARDEDAVAGFLRIVLEAVNAALAAGPARNPELVYALLHRQEALAGLRAAPRLRDLADNLQAVVDYFNARLDAVGGGGSGSSNGTTGKAGGGGKGGDGDDGGPGLVTSARPRGAPPPDWSVAQVLALIRDFAGGWRPEQLRPLPEMRFVYEEEAAPEEFFVPYVWALAVAATNGGPLHWDVNGMALLTPLAGVASMPGDGDPLDKQISLASAWSEDGYGGGGGGGGHYYPPA